MQTSTEKLKPTINIPTGTHVTEVVDPIVLETLSPTVTLLGDRFAAKLIRRDHNLRLILEKHF